MDWCTYGVCDFVRYLLYKIVAVYFKEVVVVSEGSKCDEVERVHNMHVICWYGSRCVC